MKYNAHLLFATLTLASLITFTPLNAMWDDSCGGYPPPPPIFEAALSGRPWQLQQLIDKGANVNEKIDSRYGYDSASTPLFFAAARGEEKSVSVLLAAGAQVNLQNNRGETPLHHAAGSTPAGSTHDFGDPLAVVKILIAAKANVKAMDKKGKTPLTNAIPRINPTLIKTLIDAGAFAQQTDLELAYKLKELSDASIKGKDIFLESLDLRLRPREIVRLKQPETITLIDEIITLLKAS